MRKRAHHYAILLLGCLAFCTAQNVQGAPNIKLLSPASGQVYRAGARVLVIWAKNRLPSSAKVDVQIRLNKKGWRTAVAKLPARATHAWLSVPSCSRWQACRLAVRVVPHRPIRKPQPRPQPKPRPRTPVVKTPPTMKTSVVKRVTLRISKDVTKETLRLSGIVQLRRAFLGKVTFEVVFKRKTDGQTQRVQIDAGKSATLLARVFKKTVRFYDLNQSKVQTAYNLRLEVHSQLPLGKGNTSGKRTLLSRNAWSKVLLIPAKRSAVLQIKSVRCDVRDGPYYSKHVTVSAHFIGFANETVTLIGRYVYKTNPLRLTCHHR